MIHVDTDKERMHPVTLRGIELHAPGLITAELAEHITAMSGLYDLAALEPRKVRSREHRDADLWFRCFGQSVVDDGQCYKPEVALHIRNRKVVGGSLGVYSLRHHTRVVLADVDLPGYPSQMVSAVDRVRLAELVTRRSYTFGVQRALARARDYVRPGAIIHPSGGPAPTSALDAAFTVWHWAVTGGYKIVDGCEWRWAGALTDIDVRARYGREIFAILLEATA